LSVIAIRYNPEKEKSFRKSLKLKDGRKDFCLHKFITDGRSHHKL
jgi:hypothetical protein